MVIEHVKQIFYVIISLLIELDDRIGNNDYYLVHTDLMYRSRTESQSGQNN